MRVDCSTDNLLSRMRAHRTTFSSTLIHHFVGISIGILYCAIKRRRSVLGCVGYCVEIFISFPFLDHLMGLVVAKPVVSLATVGLPTVVGHSASWCMRVLPREMLLLITTVGYDVLRYVLGSRYKRYIFSGNASRQQTFPSTDCAKVLV